MLGSDTVSTHEFGNARCFGPETELLLATLDRAALDFYSIREDLRVQAEDWLFGESDANDLFSFSWVCENLGLDPASVRRRVRELNFPHDVSQTHRWLRRKVQSGVREQEAA